MKNRMWLQPQHVAVTYGLLNKLYVPYILNIHIADQTTFMYICIQMEFTMTLSMQIAFDKNALRFGFE